MNFEEQRERARQFEKETVGKSVGYISAALGLVAGLAWNDAVTTLIEKVFPLAKDALFMKFVYAGLVTVIVILLVGYLDKFADKKENK